MSVVSSGIDVGQPARSKGRNYNLDVIRGLTAVCVAYSHLIGALKVRNELDAVGHFAYTVSKAYFDIGKFAVLVLFALSGYFMLDSIRGAEKRYERPVAAFLGQRFIRLYPLYWISLILGVLLPWDGPQTTFSWQVIALNATMLQGFFFTENVIGLYWTLQIELCFYAMCIILFLLGWAGKIRMSLLTVVCMLVFAVILAYARYAMDAKLPVALPLMVAVCFIGSMWKTSDGGRNEAAGREAWLAVAAFYIALLPICVFAYSRDHGYHETWDRYSLSYGVAMAVFLATTRMRTPFLSWIAPLGGVGYIIFLVHPSVFAAADRLGFTPAVTSIPPMFYIPIMLAIVVAFAFLIRRLILDPVLANGTHLVNYLGRQKPGTARPRDAASAA